MAGGAIFPSTMLRMVPLPIGDGEDEAGSPHRCATLAISTRQSGFTKGAWMQ